MMRSMILALLILSGSAGTAWATGNLDCTIKDKPLKFLASAIVPYGRGSPILQFKSELSLTQASIPGSLKSLEFDQSHLVHHWIRGRDVTLLLYWERDEGIPADMELVIETRRKPGKDVESRGHYELTLSYMPDKASQHRTLKFRGRASCSLG